jgi:hypothetical protein
MGAENKRVLGRFLGESHQFLGEQPKTIVEIGTWLGLSARFMCCLAPNATVYAIDHWNGIPNTPEAAAVTADPWSQFVRDCWDYRDQIVPVRGDSWAGIGWVAKHLAASRIWPPDLVYIDADHTFEKVVGDIRRVQGEWPRARIVGDDWTWPGVRQAVEFCFDEGRYNVDGNCWWVEPR